MKNYLTRKDNDYGFNFFDNLFDDFFAPSFMGRHTEMRTDIKENENGYSLNVDMPGYEKKDINLTLRNGYLTIEAVREEDESDKYVKRERSMTCQRSYYVGEGITEKDIKAKYNNGTLSLEIPKKQNKISSGRIEID